MDADGPFTDLESWQSKCLNRGACRRGAPGGLRSLFASGRNPPSNGGRELTLVLPGSRKQVVPGILLSATCFFVSARILLSAQPSFVLFSVLFFGGFGFLAKAVHDATFHHVLLVRPGSLVVRRRTLAGTDEQTFEQLDDIGLAKLIRGHGVAPLTAQAARDEFERHGTHPRVLGLAVSSGGTLHPIALSLPFESLLELCESLRTYAREHGMLSGKR